ncbi:MAG TPA: cation diffusion facilitator family transporter [Geobacteraceae bacterium]|nr:cation diffusion facilitator family transporter [Geobacteraceae bacterium]
MTKQITPLHGQERFYSADRVIRTGFWINAVLMLMKLAAGSYGNSEAVFADGLESACDFIAILASYIALRIGRRPMDRKHPYGHGRAESLAAIFISLIIFTTGIGILVRVVLSVLEGTPESPELVAVLAAVVTIVVKEWLYRFSSGIGKRLESPALMALAKDHRKDALTSVATLVGVSGAFFGARIMDPLAAGITAFFIFRIGVETFKSSAYDLMDGRPPDELIRAITKLAEGIKGVEHVHQIKARRSGQFLLIDLKLDMDPEMTVKESHDIATEVKRKIFHNHPNVGDVMIHINPHEEKHRDLTRL